MKSVPVNPNIIQYIMFYLSEVFRNYNLYLQFNVAVPFITIRGINFVALNETKKLYALYLLLNDNSNSGDITRDVYHSRTNVI